MKMLWKWNSCETSTYCSSQNRRSSMNLINPNIMEYKTVKIIWVCGHTFRLEGRTVRRQYLALDLSLYFSLYVSLFSFVLCYIHTCVCLCAVIPLFTLNKHQLDNRANTFWSNQISNSPISLEIGLSPIEKSTVAETDHIFLNQSQ
jgi:hypothetical protein